VLERAGEVALLGLKRSVEVVLDAVVDVVGDDVERFGDCGLVDVHLHHAAVVLGDELIGAAIGADESGLPCEEVGDAHLLPAGPLEFIAGAGGAVGGGHVFPAVDVLAPVVEEPCFVERVGGDELLLEVVDEAGEDVGIEGAVGAGFVVDLPADDGGVVFVMADHVGDKALGVEAIDGIVGVHVLAHAVGNSAGRALGNDEDFGVGVTIHVGTE
jgi:hypothetical protein